MEEKSSRKLIQITICMAYGDDGFMTRIYGLCDDGTIWRMSPSKYNNKWEKLAIKIVIVMTTVAVVALHLMVNRGNDSRRQLM